MQAETTKIILVPWQRFCKIEVHFPLITMEKQEIIIYYWNKYLQYSQHTTYNGIHLNIWHSTMETVDFLSQKCIHKQRAERKAT